MKPTRTVKTADTLFDIIEKILEMDSPRVSEMANELDLAKSTVYEHLATLEQKGYVVKEGEHYRLGMRFLDYGTYAKQHLQLEEPVCKSLSQLAAETGEAVWFLIEEQYEPVYLYRALGRRAVTTYGRPGKIAPVHAHASGKAILAQYDDERIRDLADERGLPAFTEATITDLASFLDEIECVRDQGYASDSGELVDGIGSVGAPVFRDGVIRGAVTISGPTNRVAGQWSDRDYASRVMSTSEEISVKLTHEG